MARIVAFIDGFNLYHSIARPRNFRNYKWLNLRKLVECFVTKSDEIKEVFYFTAYANWRPESAARHKHYVRALEFKKITPVFGQFKRRDKFCTIELSIKKPPKTDGFFIGVPKHFYFELFRNL